MKIISYVLTVIVALGITACASSRKTEENDLSEDKVMQSFEKEKSGSKIIYTGGENSSGEQDVQTSLDYHKNNSSILYSSLADRLRKIGGITVLGSGNNVTVNIRGMSSIKFSNEPIFVIDGFNVGRGYARANNAVDVNQIDEIRVLKGPAQTARYGEEGKNGVIIITTKGAKK